MKSNKKNIFYKTSGYASTRNFLSLPIKKYTFQKKYDCFKILDYMYYRLWGVNLLLRNSHWELFPSRGIWHFFNGISFGKTPWIVTYETSLPRWGTDNPNLLKFGVEALAGDYCKRLIAMSDCTKSFQVKFLEEKFPEYIDRIVPKISVIHPPQKTLIETYSEKKLSLSTLKFTLIGADFFRKGGKEILTVFDKLLQKGAPIQLNIISTLQYGDYASQATEDDLNQAKKIISKYPESIIHYKRLPNERVLEILKNSHIGLLPTYGDTYGYSVLEAQAYGCPVITTNIRALPEINDTESGWIIKVPKDRWGNGMVNTEADRAHFSNIIETSLEKILNDIISYPEIIKEKGNCSLRRIKKEHCPEDVAKKLEQIYQSVNESI